MTADVTAPSTNEDAAAFAGRIDILYALGRHYLSLPFAALCMPATLFATHGLHLIATVPLVLQIAVTIAAEQLTQAYKNRPPEKNDPHYWARRYTFVSGIAGATWGLGAIWWFVPDSYPAQAYLCLAFLGMTATEFIARSAYRPAYLTHALFALTPLVIMLLIQGGLYAGMSAILVILFAAVLYSYCNGMARLLDESIRLRLENAGLVVKLSQEKQDVEAARDAAQASAQAKAVFIANVSHELRTPLNALLGMAQLLDRAELDKPHRDHIKVMLEAGRGLKTLLDDVITLTRAEEDPDEGEDCDPSQAARAVARLLQPRAWEKNLRLHVAAPASMPHVAADPRRIRQVLLKLTDNALKFTDRGGVEVRIEQFIDENAAEWVRFTVADSGHGIPPEVVPILFKPFTPGDSSYARRQQGAGLGLAVAKRIVESFGGEIGFESEPGEGASFWFTVPLAKEAGAASSPPDEAGVSPPSGLKLLIFVKDTGIRDQVAKYLEPFGNKISIAENLATAAQQAGRNAFDAIVVEGDDADMLAAAPGVKAPLVALTGKTGRAPICAEEIVRWPASPAMLYAAFHAVKARNVAMPETEIFADLPAAIDAATFAGLEKSVGLPTLLEILKSYVEASNKLCDSLSEACGNDNWDEASRLAQDIAGAAGGLGLSAITTAARAMATKAREGESKHELRSAAQNIIAENERARLALINLYPDLAA